MIEVTENDIVATLVDRRRISVPLSWSWRLMEATPEQCRRFAIIGKGSGVHWTDIDEDISVAGMLHSIPAPRARSKNSALAGVG
jgi:hypothetical protein